MEGKGKILVVDDEEGMRQTLGDILIEEGYQVSLAKDGYQAIEKVKEANTKKENFQLVLLDIRLPGIDGVETFKEIKRINPRTDVIMMTAFTVGELVEEAIREGAFAVVYKPFDLNFILSHIEKAMKEVVILLVDDRLEEIETIKEILEHRGYKVSIAGNGQEAIKRVEEDGYNIAMIDIKMPVINGVETLRKIKEMEPHLPVIMITGYTIEELIKEALKINAYTCLYKPLDLKEVMCVINEVRRSEKKKRI
jgi:DNA-binding NtrC family response regulator